jgi:ABC-type sugar transport system permease subunit
MKRYSIFHPLVLSFFSKSLYRDVGKHWRGTGLLYLLVVLALVWIPTIIKGQLDMSRWVNGDSKEITKQIPAITISKGRVSTDVTTPYFIKDPKTGSDLALIDTTGEHETLENTDAKLLLTKSKVIISKNATETQTYDLSGVQSIYVDRSHVESWLATAKRWFVPVLYPLALIFSFIFRAIQIVVYTLVGLLFARILHAKLDFKTLMRLAAIAITPVLVLNLLFEFLPRHIPRWSLIGIVIALAYLFFAVKVNAEPEDVPLYQPPTAYPTVMP